jgi:hypothetical protein
MFFAIWHPRIWLCGAAMAGLMMAGGRAWSCGAMTGAGRIVEATERAEIKLEDGRTLRLVGLDMLKPELALDRIAQNWAGHELKIATLAPAPDRWGRWLVDAEGVDGASLSDNLLSLGIARVKPEFETRSCETERLLVEKGARDQKLGLWAQSDAVLPAANVEALAAADGRFVIVEGKIRRVGVGRSRVYVDFGDRSGFTVVAPRKVEAALQRRGLNLTSLAGHAVRVRGVMDNRFGPRIELADPLMIERIEGAGGSGPGG